MAKKKKTDEPASPAEAVQAVPEVAEQPRGLSDLDRERAERVLVSQGRAKAILPSLPEAMQQQLAELCTPEGEVLPAAVAGVRDVLTEYFTQQKAVVDEAAGD